jgi:hypothetical protein
MKQLGQCNAAVHSVCGEWFGYVKAGERFHFDSWASAFSAMTGDVLNDARARGFRLPFDAIEKTRSAFGLSECGNGAETG